MRISPTLLEKYWPIPALQIDLNLPPWGRMFALSLCGFAILSLYLSAVPLTWLLPLSLVLICYAQWAFPRVHRWRGSEAICTLHANNGQFQLGCGEHYIRIRLRPDSLVWQQLVFLDCEGVSEPGQVSLLLFPSTMELEDWRRLRLHTIRALELYRP